MKKKWLLLLFAFFLVFVSGCEKKEERLIPGELGDLKFVSPSTFSEKELIKITGNEQIFTYTFDSDPSKSVTIYYNKHQNYSYVEGKNGDKVTYENVEINGVAWRKNHSEDQNYSDDYYYVVYNDALYQVDISNANKYRKEFDAFINSLKF